MNLAEDRILSLEIFCSENQSFLLQYIPNAVAYTDPQEDIIELMK